MAQIDTKKETKIFTPSPYNVLLHNDDKTTMDFVVDVLVQIFDKSFDDAVKVMLKIHNEGVAICGSYTKEIALTKQHHTINAARAAGFPLRCTVEVA